METQKLEGNRVPDGQEIAQPLADDTVTPGAAQPPKWRAIFREAFNKARSEQQPTTTRRELGKDRSKSLILVGGAAVLLLFLFFAVFSSPNKPGTGSAQRPGTPNLGRKDTPGQDGFAQTGKSVTPILSADLRQSGNSGSADVTPEDVDRTARARPSRADQTSLGTNRPPEGVPSQYALSKINVPESDLPPATQPSSSSEDFRKPSIVYVRAINTSPAANSVAAILEPDGVTVDLSAGTRLIARLESPASSAARTPVIAVVEYNYERDGVVVVPAGAKVLGKLEQVNSSGYVGIHFESIEMPDGTIGKIDATAMDLSFKPLKGNVTGKNNGKKFLVSSLTGLGSAAAVLVGGGGTAFTGPISESSLLRERLADNIGIAGDQQLMNLAYNQNIVVTVPGNTRFFLVFQKGTSESHAPRGQQPANVTQPELTTGRVPSLEELRQLMQLKQELSQLYQTASQTSTSSAPQP